MNKFNLYDFFYCSIAVALFLGSMVLGFFIGVEYADRVAPKKDPINIQIMDTSSLFCNKHRCSLTNEDGELLMWDELAHLTPAGLQRLEPTLLQTLQELLPKGDNEKL